MITFEKLIGMEELTKELNISKYTIYSLRRNQKFPKGVKLNGKRFFKVTELEDYFKSLNIKAIIEK
jgi:predicted DNA-binding transcriptional regulator AlpA